MLSATIKLTNQQAGDTLSLLGTLPSSITSTAYNPATGEMTLSGSATISDYQTAIEQIGFSTTSTNNTDRIVSVTVSDGGLSSNTALSTIAIAPAITINDVSVNEAAGTMTFTVSLSNPSATAVTVDYDTASASAAEGDDFANATGTLTFAAGVTAQTITVNVTDDATFEGAETFTVDLSGATNASISDATGLGTIIDDGTGTGGTDDDTPTLTVSNQTVTEGSDTHAVFTVALANPSTTAVTVALALTDGTATSADYGAALEVSTNGGTTWTAATAATFTPGATSILVRTPVMDDAIDEAAETFDLTATVTSGLTANPADTGTTTIADENVSGLTDTHAPSDNPNSIINAPEASTTTVETVQTSGIVLDAVSAARSLKGITGGIGEQGIVVSAVNQAAFLNSQSDAQPLSHDRISQIAQSVERNGFGYDAESWEPRGLTGFSLRLDLAETKAGLSDSIITIEALVHKRSLIVSFSKIDGDLAKSVKEYRINQMNGQPLPSWLDRAGANMLIGQRPANVDRVDLKVTVIYADSSFEERAVQIETKSGALSQIELQRDASLTRPFIEQFEKSERVTAEGTAALADLLTP